MLPVPEEPTSNGHVELPELEEPVITKDVADLLDDIFGTRP